MVLLRVSSPEVESLLGLKLEVDKLRFAPCLPADWQEFKVHYRYRETVYHITVLQTVACRDDCDRGRHGADTSLFAGALIGGLHQRMLYLSATID